MGLLGGFFLFLFSKISVMLFLLLLFKFSIKLCLIELFSTAVWRLAGGFGSEWEERGGVRASKQNVTHRALACPLHTAAHKEGQYLRGVCSTKSSVEISVSRNANNKGYLYLSVSLSEIRAFIRLPCSVVVNAMVGMHVKLHCAPNTPFFVVIIVLK